MRLTRPSAALIVAMTALSLVSPVQAQQRRSGEAASVQTAASAPVTSGATAEETKRDLDELFRQFPPSLPRVLHMDPSLLGNPGYLQTYPSLATFLSQHPEVVHNPSYFLAAYEDGRGRMTPQDRAIDMWRNAIESFTIGTVMLAIGAGVIWLIKTFIEHRRWSRLSKIQMEVHNKLMDRFTANEDLLAYIQTPAGKRFLESAPIPLDSPRSINAPLGRILWSAQAGAVATVLGGGVLVVSQNTLEEVASPLAGFGIVIIALGLGFIASAFLAYVLTRRFGLMPDPAATEPRG
jgi:hypothetical protein